MTPAPQRPTPSPFAVTVQTYRPPVPETPTDLKLNANEGMLLKADWMDTLSKLPSEAVCGYPSSASLEADIAQAFHLDSAQVLVGTGGDDVVERAIRAYLAPGRTMIMNDPSFAMLERYATLAGGTTVLVPWMDGGLPVDDMLARVDETTTMIVVVSPNNPTGLTATTDDLRRLRDAAPSAMLLVDLAYGEFADGDLTDVALSLPDTIVIRSFSKAWGLAGLRAGWAASSPDIIEQLRSVGHPYPVSTLSAAIVSSMLATGKPLVEEFVKTVRSHREQLSALLGDLGAAVTPSQGNFVLARFDDATWVRDALAGMGIAVRAFPDVPVLTDYLRITVPGCPDQLRRLCDALKTILRPEHVLIDPLATDAPAFISRVARPGNTPAIAPIDPSGIRDLNATCAWCVGTSIEAILDARRAGVLPLAIASPHGPQPEAFCRAGAARVLTTLDQLQELLP